MNRTDKLKALRDDIDTTKKATQKLVLVSDISVEEYGELLELYPKWEVELAVKPSDAPYEYKGSLYQVIQAHTTQADWTPDSVPALFKKVEPKEDKSGAEIVPDFKKPTGAHDAYKKGDKVGFEGKIYESLIDNNAYSPKDYPAGWKVIE